MQFVEEHLTRHHLLHKPHKWFLALLSSPIHFAEMHYKKKYHLNFKHAKKLFVFDIVLLLSIIALASASVSWFYYNPDIVDQIELKITPSSDRIISGDYITYSINYKNNSEKKLINATLLINLPAGLVVDKIEPDEFYEEKNHSFDLQELLKNEAGEIKISGWYYDTPHQETHVTTELLYNQEDRTTQEVRLTNLIQIHRGSALNLQIESIDKILSQGSIPIKFILQNNGKQTINNISLPLYLDDKIKLTNLQPQKGLIDQNIWKIEELKPAESTEIDATLSTQIPAGLNSIELGLTPEITINNTIIKQETLIKNFLVSHPEVVLASSWQDGITQTSPGENLVLNLNIKNQGDTDLNDLKVLLPLEGNVVINTNKLKTLNSGILKNNFFEINQNYSANLKNLAKNESTNITITIPILNYPSSGTDLTLTLIPQINASVDGITNAVYQNKTETPPIKIGTSLNFSTEIRYYTDEGDQLGRGPLPPQVDKETKYWLWFQLQNGTSRVSDLNFSAKLPEYVVWTGKSSVSNGVDIIFDESSRTANWSINSLSPHEKIGIYFELSFTPTIDQVGQSPFIIQNININALDTYITKELGYTTGPQDISLYYDLIGKNKGVTVIR